MTRWPVRRERSAGGVLYRVRGGRVEVCLIATRGRTRWQLPKGLVEKGERPEAAAEREVAEETGCRGRAVEPLDRIEFWYVATEDGGRVRVHKTVDVWLLEYAEGDTARHDAEVDAAEWMPIEEAIARCTFENERAVLRAARDRIAARLRTGSRD